MKTLYLSKFTKYIAIPQHLLGVLAIYLFFELQLSWWWLALSYVGWVVLGVFGVSTMYHKYYSHRAFEFKPQYVWVGKLFTLLGALCGQGSPIGYAAVHRLYHHPYADKDERDPHSPHVHGFWHSYYGWHFKPAVFQLRKLKDVLDDTWATWIHKNYYRIWWCGLLMLSVIDWRLALYGMIIPGLIHVHEMNILNSLSHMKWFGYRNFDTDEHSVNNWIFGVLSWGTGYHNNHHAVPNTWHNQVRWFEFDPFRYIMPPLIAKGHEPPQIKG
jgi:stearoyl-CoA desaturase (delta-9 desaturase)